jgi:hypothetical protein
MTAADIAKKTDSAVVHSASDVSIRVLEALCLDDEFQVLRETLKLYREELAKSAN